MESATRQRKDLLFDSCTGISDVMTASSKYSSFVIISEVFQDSATMKSSSSYLWHIVLHETLGCGLQKVTVQNYGYSKEREGMHLI